jgi:hypothetical protein
VAAARRDRVEEGRGSTGQGCWREPGRGDLSVQGNREQTADGPSDRAQARVKRCGKSAPASGATPAARQPPPGARSNRGRAGPATSPQVDRTDGWSPIRRPARAPVDRTPPTGRLTIAQPCDLGSFASIHLDPHRADSDRWGAPPLLSRLLGARWTDQGRPPRAPFHLGRALTHARRAAHGPRARRGADRRGEPRTAAIATNRSRRCQVNRQQVRGDALRRPGALLHGLDPHRHAPTAPGARQPPARPISRSPPGPRRQVGGSRLSGRHRDHGPSAASSTFPSSWRTSASRRIITGPGSSGSTRTFAWMANVRPLSR